MSRIPPNESLLQLFEPIEAPGREFTGYQLYRPGTGSVDIPIEEAKPNIRVYPFGTSPNDKVELHIYSMVDSLIESTYDVPYNRVAGLLRATQPITLNSFGASDDPGINSVKINLHSVFRDLGYISGRFKFQLNFHRNVLGTVDAPASLVGISADRTELTLLYSGSVDSLLQTPKADQVGNRTEFYVNVGDNKLFRVSNFTQDTLATTSRGDVYIIALQNPLPGEIGPGIPIWVDVQTSDPQNDVIIIYPKKRKEEYNDLKGPNYNIETNEGFARSTGFRSWDSLLGSNPTSSQQLINNLISSSFDVADLAIDYRNYSEFIFYSSAEERLKNFRYKLQLLEYYDGLLNTTTGIPSPSIAVTNNINDLTVKRNAILSGFDGYEKYLYYESSSYESSSYGEFTPTSWPKSNSNRPYVNFSITSSEAQTWYAGQLESASLYDNRNGNALQYLIPEHIRESTNNESYTAFVNMMGQHFDILWTYVHHLTRVHTREDSLIKGLSKDLIYHVLRSLGIDSINGFKIEELWLQSLGLDDTGNYRQTGSLQSIPTGDISKETWKRILNNLPYLLKTKGTRRGIRALLNCYGVPSTVYRVKEYTGPYQYKSNTFDINAQHRKIEKYTLATHFNGSNSFNASLSGANTRMFRFKPVTNSSTNIGTNISATYVDGLQDVLTVGGASLTGPWYNGRWTTVIVAGSTTYAFQSVDGRVIEYSDSGGTITGVFGGAGCNVYVQEVKGWSSTLDIEILRELARNPQSIIGSDTVDVYSMPNWQNSDDYNYQTAYTELLYRYPLGSTLQIYTGSSMPSIHPNRSVTATATISGFTTASYVSNEEDYYVWYPNLGEGIDLSEKIRIQPANVSTELHRNYSVESEEFDPYCLDSPKVGVFFSPQDEINEDIADQFSGLLLDDIVGDPRDDYNTSYKKLEEIRNHYNLKFTGENSFWKYIRLIENFDASMFFLIKKFLPARAVKLVGLVIQPTLLERPKTFIRPMMYEKVDLEAALPGYYTEFNATEIDLEAQPIVINRIQEASTETYQETLDPLIINHVIDSTLETQYAGTVTVQQGSLSNNVEFINLSAGVEYTPTGKYNQTYGGCKMSSRAFNIPSPDTPDGGPVVEIWTNNPNNPIHSINQGGNLAFTGGGRQAPGQVPAAIVGRVNPNFTGPIITGPVVGTPEPVTGTLGGRAIVNVFEPGTGTLGGRAIVNVSEPVIGPLGGRAIVNRTGTGTIGGGAM